MKAVQKKCRLKECSMKMVQVQPLGYHQQTKSEKDILAPWA
jgi:hypothetical protein